jgi:hypothetical protein
MTALRRTGVGLHRSRALSLTAVRPELPRHRKVKHGTEAKLLIASSPSQCRRCIANHKSGGRRTMRGLHLSIRQVELVRILFSIGMTVSVSVGTFLAIRHLIGLSE